MDKGQVTSAVFPNSPQVNVMQPFIFLLMSRNDEFSILLTPFFIFILTFLTETKYNACIFLKTHSTGLTVPF